MTWTVGVGIVAREHHDYLDLCVDSIQEQADAVNVLVDPDLCLSAARNKVTTGLETDVYAFIDADAYASEEWVDELRTGYDDGAVAVGGPAARAYHPDVPYDRVPRGWEWLVGVGPRHTSVCQIRNTYGTNYSMRADIFDSLDGFDETLGKGTAVPHGEETDLARRMYEEYGERMEYRPEALVFHHVTPADVRRRTLLKRAYDQGVTKAVIGNGNQEHDFVREQVSSLSPWRAALLGAAGVGYARGKVMAHA